jgi:hypothetical protein
MTIQSDMALMAAGSYWDVRIPNPYSGANNRKSGNRGQIPISQTSGLAFCLADLPCSFPRARCNDFPYEPTKTNGKTSVSDPEKQRMAPGLHPA